MRTVNNNGAINGLNANQYRRDEILKLAEPGFSHDIVRFSNLTLTQLDDLLRNNFIAWDEAQNEGPTVEDIHTLLVEHPKFTAHGYAVSKSRSDYRVSLEGVEYKGKPSKAEMAKFIKLCKDADEFTCEANYLRAWWD